MIHSMTAFTEYEIKSDWGVAIWELRSLNQRYLDIRINLPEKLHKIDPLIRRLINKNFARGKIECNLYLNFNNNIKNNFVINEQLVCQLLSAIKYIQSKHIKESKIDISTILRWPGVIINKEHNFDTINQELINGLVITINNVLHNRNLEGYALKNLIEQCLFKVSMELTNIRKQLIKAMTLKKNKLLNKIANISIKLDPQRIEQEILILIQKNDISEELDRLEIHIKEIHKIISKKEAVGRHLDFMMQELNREANTLASKAIDSNIVISAVELKVLIERMREQIQNIE